MQFVPKFQMGGEMAPPTEEAPIEGGAPEGEMAPAPEEQAGGQDPLMMIAQAAMQALQSQDCQMAMQVCQAFLQLIQQAQAGGGAAPAPEEQGTPVFKKGGRLSRRIKK